MKLIENGNLKKVIADENKHIRAINDVYKPAYIDEYGNEIEEHYPDYFTEAYVPPKVTEENLAKWYVEEDM